MADKEQELKFTCQGCGQRLPSGNTPHNYEDCQTHIKRVTDLLGYVKWDREKVARLMYEGGAPKPYFDWDTVREQDKNYYLRQADQLKEILTGGF